MTRVCTVRPHVRVLPRRYNPATHEQLWISILDMERVLETALLSLIAELVAEKVGEMA